MVQAKVYSFSEKKETGVRTLDDSVFSVPVRPSLIHDVMKGQLANKRQGTASSKTRGEVVGSTRKPWAQKKTGRARAGSVKSPLWRGGGVTFGPRPRSYKTVMPKKMRRGALLSLLSHIASEGRVFIMEDVNLAKFSTSTVGASLMPVVAAVHGSSEAAKKTNYAQRRLVFAMAGGDEPGDVGGFLRKSSNNLPWVIPTSVDSLEIKDLFYARAVVFTAAAYNALVAKITSTAEVAGSFKKEEGKEEKKEGVGV